VRPKNNTKPEEIKEEGVTFENSSLNAIDQRDRHHFGGLERPFRGTSGHPQTERGGLLRCGSSQICKLGKMKSTADLFSGLRG